MKEFGLLFVVIFSFTSAMVIISYQEKNTCDMNVMMNDGTIFKAKNVNWYPSGIADIKKCSGERIQIPTHHIKKVKFIK